MADRPPFVPVNITDAINTGIQFDTDAYARSDADFAKRFGTNLVPGRDFSVNAAQAGLTSQINPQVSNALSSAGLDNNFGSTNIQQAKNLGQSDLLSFDKRGRNYFQQILGQNPKRSIGPSGKDVANIALANTGGYNNFNVSNYGANVNSYNQQLAANAANSASYASDANSALGLIAKNFIQPQQSSYLGIGAYGAPYGYNPSSYTSSSGTYFPATSVTYGG